MPTVTVGVLLVVLFGVLEGGGAALSAALGGAMALAALAVGPLLLRSSAQLSPPAVMAVALTGYGVVVLALGLVYVLVGEAGWLHGTAVGVSLLTCSFAWMAGHLRATGRMRVLAFGDLKDPADAADQVSEGGAGGRSGGGW